jgi:RHS repeat-associated protein
LTNHDIYVFALDELHLYGSSRLGMLSTGLHLVVLDMNENIIFEAETSDYTHRDLGKKRYELNNHLGNVIATVTDKKVYINLTSGIKFDPEIISINDYYPFGAPIAVRSYSGGEYRYGFNGKEIDNEVKGTGAQYDYGFRIYDPRIGKFLSVDPLFKNYPWYTPYQFAGNMPIVAIDLDGLEQFNVAVVYSELVNGYNVTIEMISPSGPLTLNYNIQTVHGTENYQRNNYTLPSENERRLGEHIKNTQNVNSGGFTMFDDPLKAFTTQKKVDPTNEQKKTDAEKATKPIETPIIPTLNGVEIKRGNVVKSSIAFKGNVPEAENESAAFREVNELAKILISNPEIKVTITGNARVPEGARPSQRVHHGRYSFERLAQMRADIIKNTLTRAGVSEDRISTKTGDLNSQTATYEFETK